MYSRRLSVSGRALSQLRQRTVPQRGGAFHKQLFPVSTSMFPAPCGAYNHHSQQPIMHNAFAMRHFSSDSSEKDKDKEKDKAIVAKEKKPSKFEYYKKVAADMVRSGAYSTYLFFRHPTLIPGKLKYTWGVIKEEAHHYHLGFKLLIADVRTAKDIIFRILGGHSMTRRERLQLMRTVSDLARLVPFSVFILIPFMELLLPLAIKMFPNMLPSTFEDSLKKEENMKNELNMRLSVASFFIDTIKTMAEQKKKKTKGKKDDEAASEDNASATELIEFMERARMGEPLPHEAVVRIARLFKDELTLANMPRPQLVTMCQFMNLQPFGSDTFLRFQLRTKLNSIKEDDKRILWEGVDSLSAQELRDACRERGMRATGLNTFGYRKQIKEWLDLSMLKHTPISLLIMSRAFVLNLSEENLQKRYEESLQTSISSMDEDVVNEVILQSASAKEVNTADMKKRKLESLQFQNELIQEELAMALEFKRKEQESQQLESVDKAKKLQLEKEKEKEAGKEGDKDSSKDSTKASAATAGAGAGQEILETEDAGVATAVIGIGDRRRVVDADDPFGSSALEEAAGPPPTFDKQFIQMVEGSKFEGDICADLAKSVTQAVIENAEAEKGSALTASEVQALGDMALQSAVEREKNELAKLKSQMKDLKLDKKARKKVEEAAAAATAAVAVPSDASVDNAEILALFEKEVAEARRAQQISELQGRESNVTTSGSSSVSTSASASTAASGTGSGTGTGTGSSRGVSQKVQEADLVYKEPSRQSEEGVSVDGTSTASSTDEKKKTIAPSAATVDKLGTAASKKEEDEDEEEDEEEDHSLLRMKSLIDGMMTRLESRLTETESALGDKLHKLDVDRDGVLRSDELQSAVMQLLRRHSSSKDEKSAKEAADLIKLLDQDNDGRITVQELMQYVASRDVLTEAESKMFESQKPKAPPATPTKEE